MTGLSMHETDSTVKIGGSAITTGIEFDGQIAIDLVNDPGLSIVVDYVRGADDSVDSTDSIATVYDAAWSDSDTVSITDDISYTLTTP
jgi:hypothetical protein